MVDKVTKRFIFLDGPFPLETLISKIKERLPWIRLKRKVKEDKKKEKERKNWTKLEVERKDQSEGVGDDNKGP